MRLVAPSYSLPLAAALLLDLSSAQTLPVEWVRLSPAFLPGLAMNAAPGSGVITAARVLGTGQVLRRYDPQGNASLFASRPLSHAPANIAVHLTDIYVASDAINATVSRYDSSGNLLWTRDVSTTVIGGAGGLAADDTGVTLAGYVRGALPGQTFAGGNTDAFVRRYDLAGNVLWTRQIGTSEDDYIYAVATDGASFVVAGITYGVLPGQIKAGNINSGDAFVARLDQSGNIVAARQFGGSNSTVEASGVAVFQNSVYVAGSLSGALSGQTQGGYKDGFVKKLDANFGDLWTRQFGVATVGVTVTAIAVQQQGVAVAGHVRGDLTGAGTSTSSSPEDAFARIYDLAGNPTGTVQVDSDNRQTELIRSATWAGGALYLGGITFGRFGSQGTPGNSSGLLIKLLANRAPVANAGPDQTVECASPAGTAVTLSGAASADPDGDTLSYEWRDSGNALRGTSAALSVSLPVGVHMFHLTVSDGKGGTATDSVQVTVRDTVAPAISVSLSPNVLWPANNKMVAVTASITVSDACSAPAVTLESIVNNETTGAGDIAGADFGTDDRSFSLRATRLGQGNGRTYTVTYRATDSAGNGAARAAVVQVPHNQ